MVGVFCYNPHMEKNDFEVEYQKLNKAQKEAVDSIEGPVMVIAGPGTGKTTILTLRIANILRLTDTPPSGILALTFTDAGVRAMRAKLRTIIGERALEIPIHTFHGFAMSVIREFEDHFPHLARSKELTEVEAENLIRKILKQPQFAKLRPSGDPEYYVGKIIGTVSGCKREAWTPEMVMSFAKEEIGRIKNDESSLSTRGKTKGELKGEALKRIEKCERTILFAQVYEEYEKIKKEERKIDFDDMLFELLQALRTDGILLRSLQEKYLYLMVDEHQDTNDTQNLIVKLIANFFESPNLFVVGDEKQAIYRFQGASVENFLGFQKTWGNMKIIPLEENYRSHQDILDTAFQMIEKNYREGEHEDLRVKLLAKSKLKPEPIELSTCPDQTTEEVILVERLKNIKEEDPESTIAIIVRRNSDVERLLTTLEESGIPAQAEKGANIFEHPIGQMYFALIDFLADPSKIESLADTFARGLWQLSFADQTKLIALARSHKTQEIFSQLPQIEELQKAINHSGVIEYLVYAADVSGFTEIARTTTLGSAVWRAILNLSEEIARSQGIESPKSLIEALLSYKKTAEKRSIKIKAGKNGAQIHIMTAHGSKGLEFDYVFLPYALEESWIKRDRSGAFVLPREKENEDDIRDDRRLFYVALTRAKKAVTISYHLESSAGKAMTPLRFIDELGLDTLSVQTPEPKTKEVEPKSLQTLKNRLDTEKIEFAKSVILEKGLSVTALNHFLECPNKFFYKSILKLPEAPNPTSEKGNAMHEAMRQVWQHQNKSEAEIKHTIETAIKNYLEKSLLFKFEKEVILKELLEDAPKVASELVPHFNQPGRVLTEEWQEKEMIHTYGKEKIAFRIHGKLDTVIEQEKNILIYDYKTKKAMSVNAIKGETSNENGDYFRQLVFYKMLLKDKEKYKSKTIEPALVFVRPDEKGRCPTISLPIEEADIRSVEDQITLLIDTVWSGQLLSQKCEDPDCKYCKY